MWSPALCAGSRKMIGPAVTVKMVDASDTSAPETGSRHFADCNEAGKVMYVRQPRGFYSACWGGLMSTRAAFLGAQGVVVDGRVRDLSEHREKDIPVGFLPSLSVSSAIPSDDMTSFVFVEGGSRVRCWYWPAPLTGKGVRPGYFYSWVELVQSRF